MEFDRRTFVRTGAGAVCGGLLKLSLAQDKKAAPGWALHSRRDPRDDLAAIRYAGVEAVSIWTSIEDNN